jgi:two-component system, cell cycle sensor histidine kinase and response regulator CckA
MLAYSGKGRFIVEPICLNEFVEEMGHLLNVSISKKAVLKYDFADNLPTFDGDASQIRQIILNLITNASEAIGDKSGVVALSTGAMECDWSYLNETTHEIPRAGLSDPLPEGIYTYFEVADTGCGMTSEILEKVFDPFFTTKFTGRGLGMAAVLGIVRGHGGAIKIYSEVNKGTTFKILFPANESSDTDLVVQHHNQPEKDTWKGEGTILIADDEESICAVGKQMLGRLGFDALLAADGREAVELFRQHPAKIDCVLLDLTMPHMDGEQAFREMRRIRSDIKVILCSGYNMQDATQRFAGKGLAGFIQKPYNLTQLREALREALDHDGNATTENVELTTTG